MPERRRDAGAPRLGVVPRRDEAARESWLRYHLRLGPLSLAGRLLFYAIAVLVVLGLAWVLVGSTLTGLVMSWRSFTAGP
jgi:hypothetical protein